MSELFYIQHKGFVGNCLLFWRVDGKGYTCDIDAAWKVSQDDALRICEDRPKEDLPRPAAIVEAHVKRRVLYLPDPEAK